MSARSKKLDDRSEDEILRHAEHVDAGLVRVEAVRLTMPVLKKAGFVNVTPFHRYLVPVEYVEGGFLRVKMSRRTA